MVNWLFDKSDLRKTPSIADGIPYDTEQRYRREGARFIIKVGTKMNLRYDTMATGVVYFHRFYMCHSFKVFARYPTACCCLFLAGKVEETPKKCKDIIRTAREFLTTSQFTTFGDDPKEEVLTLERILLQTINFHLQVDHPYTYLIKYAKSLKGDKEKLQRVVQMAWTFINDSLCTTISLLWEPEVIAISLCYLAGKLSKFEIIDWEGRKQNQQRWWDTFVEDLPTDMIEDVCHQVLDLYQIPIPDTPQDSPPNSPGQPTIANNNDVRIMTGPPPPPSLPPLPPPPPPPPSLSLSSQMLNGLDTVPNILTNVSVIKAPNPGPMMVPGQPFANYGFPTQYTLVPNPQLSSIPMVSGPNVQHQLSVPGTTWEFAPQQSYMNMHFSTPN